MSSNSVSNRKDARKALATLLRTITTFKAVYDYSPKEFSQSPIAYVEGFSQFPDPQGSALSEAFKFVITVAVNRADAAAAEDLVDDLAQQIAIAVNGWHNAQFFQESQLLYDDEGGQSYRMEAHFVSIDWE